MHWDDDANEEFEWEEVDDKREALNMLFDDDAAVSALITSGEEGGEEGALHWAIWSGKFC